MTYKTTKIGTGFYQLTFENGLVFTVEKVDEMNKWYWLGQNGLKGEGGNEWYNSKKEAVEAVEYHTKNHARYLANREAYPHLYI